MRRRSTAVIPAVSLLVLLIAILGPAARHAAPAVHARLDASRSSTSTDPTEPGSVGQSNGTEDLFWKAAGGQLMHAWYTNGSGWEPGQDMGGMMNSAPDPVTSGGGVLDAFWQGSEGNLWHVWYVGGKWYGPQDLGMGVMGAGPQAVSSQGGVIDVFWRGGNDGLWHAWYVGGSWYGPQELAPQGTVLSDPEPVSDASGAIQVFYKGSDGGLHMVAYAGGWQSPVELPAGTIGSTPHAVVVSAGQIDVAWQGADGGLWYGTLSGTTWAGPRSGSAGHIGSQPHLVSTAGGRADVYWQGQNGWLWEEQLTAAAPQGLRQLPTSTMGSEPDPDVTSPNSEDIFWRGQNGGIWHEWGDGSTSWAGPQQLDGPTPSSLALGVPFYHQQESLTCEEAGLRMALAYFGIGVSEQQVLNAEGVDLTHYWTGAGGGDPFNDFVGNPNGSEITNTGYGSYWSAVSRAAGDLGGSVAEAGMGVSASYIYNSVLSGDPVIFWVPYDWDTPGRQDYIAYDGRDIPYAGPEEHAMVVVGVTPSSVEVNDPDRGQYWVSRAQFEANYAVYGDMAVVIR